MSPLSIAIIGLGGIGSTFAFQLSRAGHEVTAIARPDSLRAQQLRRDQAVVRKTGERAEMSVSDELDEQVIYDLVVVTTLAHQVEALLPALKRSQARCIHFMFNTFDPERLRDAVGEGRCTFGMPFVMATLDGEGRLDATISPARKTLHSDRRWVELFASAGVPSAFESAMLLWLRCHVPLCIAMESVAVAGQRRGGGASWANARAAARGVRGGFTIVEAQGYRLYPRAKSLLNAAPTVLVAGLLWVVSRNAEFRNLLATGVNECRALIDVVADAAAHAQAVPPAAVEAVLAMKPTEGV